MELFLTILAILVLAIFAMIIWKRTFKRIYIFPGEVGLVYAKDGYDRELGRGLHSLFDPFGNLRVFRVSKVAQALHGQVIEVISKDQFAFRLTVTPILTIADPKEYIEGTRAASEAQFDMLGFANDYIGNRYELVAPTLASSIIVAVANVTLDEFLANPGAALEQARPSVAAVLPGAKLDSISLTAINLPPEVRKMFTEAERARREALASLERARGEQAALRALSNAARSLADNPELARLRMLQTMENAKGAKTFILGDRSDELPKADR